MAFPYAQARVAFEHRYWINLLQETDGNVSKAARLSGVNHTDIYKRFKRYGVILPARTPGKRQVFKSDRRYGPRV